MGGKKVGYHTLKPGSARTHRGLACHTAKGPHFVWWGDQMAQMVVCCKPPPVTAAPRVRTLRNPHNLQDQLRPLATKLASSISASLTSLFKPREPEFCPPDVLPQDVEDMYDTMYTPPPGRSIPLYEETKEWLEEKIAENCVRKPDPYYQFDGTPDELPDEEGMATVFLRAQRLRLIARFYKQQGREL